MSDKRNLFAKIVLAEIEDLIEDIHRVESLCKSRFEGLEIGDYVFKENTALLVKEEDSLAETFAWFGGLDPQSYPDVDAIKGSLDAFVRDRVDTREYPEAVRVFLDRKIAKALKYIDSEGESL
jgi:hypothetical protein